MIAARPALPGALAALALVLALSSCDVGPKPIRYGRDECAECKMTLVDRHYGAELITARGKVHKFDDLNCLLTFQRRDSGRASTTPQLVVIEFDRPDTFLPVEQALFLRHDRLNSPMGSGLAAFSTAAGLEATRGQLGGGGRVLRWGDVAATP